MDSALRSVRGLCTLFAARRVPAGGSLPAGPEGGPMQTRIQGTTMPVLEVQLDPNESVFSESGELSWMTQSIQMTTHTQMGGGGGLFGVFKRVVGGGSLFITEYRAWQFPAHAAFAPTFPGHILPMQ